MPHSTTKDGRLRKANRLLIKLSGIIGLLSVSLLVLGIFHVGTLSSLDRLYSTLLQNDLARLQLIQQVTGQTFSINRGCLNLLVDSARDDSKALEASIKKSLVLQTTAMDRLRLLEWPDRNSFDSLELAIKSYNVSVQQFLQILQEKGANAANEFRAGEMRPQMDRLNEQFGAVALSTYNEALFTSQESSVVTARNSLIGTLLAAWPFLVALAGLVWMVAHLIRYFSQSHEEDELPV